MSNGTTGVYVYQPPQVSLLYKHVLKPLYMRLCPYLFPRFLHPNVVTLIGFVFGLACFLLVALTSHGLTDRNTIPFWALIGAGLCFWMYSVCDNCDGMQARRLGLSSPVGELVDHGVDAFVYSMTLKLLSFLFFVDDGPNPMNAYFIEAFQYGFLMTHFSSVFHGNLILGWDYMSIDELFILTGGLFVCEAFFPRLLLDGTSLDVRIWLVVPFLVAALVVSIKNFTAMKASDVPAREIAFQMYLPCVSYHIISLSLAPYDLYWFFTFLPFFALLVVSTALRHIKAGVLTWQWSMYLTTVVCLISRHYLPYEQAMTLSVVCSWACFVYIANGLFTHLMVFYKLPTLFTVPVEIQKKKG